MLSLYNIIDASINKNHHGDKRLSVRIARVTLPLSSLPGAREKGDQIVSVDKDEPRKPIIGIYIASTKHVEVIRHEIHRSSASKAWKSDCAADRELVFRAVMKVLEEQHQQLSDEARKKVLHFSD